MKNSVTLMGKASLVLSKILLIVLLFSCRKEAVEDQTSKALNTDQSSLASTLSLTSNPLIYEETFEGTSFFPKTGTDLNLTSGIENCNNSSTITPSTYDWTLSRQGSSVYQGVKASRFEVRKDQPLVGSAQRHRSEVVIIRGDEDPEFTADIWYSFAVLFPTLGMETDALSRDIINQWFEDANDDNTIKVDKGKVYFEATPNTGSSAKLRFDLFSQTVSLPQSNDVSDMVDIVKDKWNTFTFHFVHSFNDGLIDVYRNGTLIHHITGRTMHLKFPKWKLGLYKATMSSSLHYSRAILFDNIRVGNSSATLADMTSAQNPTSNIAPTVTISSPVTNASFTSPASITINASAADPDGTIGEVSFYNGSTLLGKDNSSPYSFIWNNVNAGNYTITAKATDNSGAATTSSPVSVSVTSTPALKVVSYTLVNSNTEKDIMTIANGATISLKQIGTNKLNIRANLSGSADKVNFVLSGTQSRSYTDRATPYALMGDNGSGNYYYGNWNPPALGTYTLKATPVKGTDATLSTTINFTFVQ